MLQAQTLVNGFNEGIGAEVRTVIGDSSFMCFRAESAEDADRVSGGVPQTGDGCAQGLFRVKLEFKQVLIVVGCYWATIWF